MGLFRSKTSNVPDSLGTDGVGLSTEDLTEIYADFHLMWEAQSDANCAAIWERRHRIGYNIPAFTELRQNLRFWIDTYPILAAEILALSNRAIKDQDFLRHLAREALANMDPTNSGHQSAQDILRKHAR